MNKDDDQEKKKQVTQSVALQPQEEFISPEVGPSHSEGEVAEPAPPKSSDEE